MLRTIYYDGNYLKASGFFLDPYTPGKLRAKGVFETMLSLDGMVMDVAAHLRRLRQGLKKIGIKPPAFDPKILSELIKANRLVCARVRLLVWQEESKTRVMAMALPYKIPDKLRYRVCLIKTWQPTGAALANVKSLKSALVFAKAYTRARQRGFDEALLLNSRGYIFEASRSNIFWTKHSVLYTPPLSSGCLNGITRRQVIQQAKKLKLRVKEENLTPEILRQADAAFLTNSLIGIKPIKI